MEPANRTVTISDVEQEEQLHKPTPVPTAQRTESFHRARSEEVIRTVSSTRPRKGRPESDDPDVVIVDWDGPDDPDNPFKWSIYRKLAITAVALIGTLLFQMNGTSITVAAIEINREFGISDASFPNSYWPVTSWTLGGATVTLIILPLMEDFGLRDSYIATFVAFFLFVIPQAVAKNFATEIVCRFFAGGFATTLSNAVASVICDVWEGEEGRAVPMSIWITCYLGGASLGPVFGASILEFLPWRWIFYIELIIYGVFFPISVICLKETRGNVILRGRAKKIRATTGQKAYTYDDLHGPKLSTVLYVAIKRPLYMFCTEFVVFAFTMWSAFSTGLLYLFTQSSGQVYTALYGWPDYSTGYVQGSIVIGMIVGFFVWWVVQKPLYFASAPRNTEDPGIPIPEARLYTAIFGAMIGMGGGMFVYAWTAYPSIHWIGPSFGLGMVGFGINIVVIAIAEYVTDCYSKFASSAVAVVACGENVFAAFLPLAAASMYTNLGFQWASSLLAFLALLLGGAPIFIFFKGKTIRAKSPFIREAKYEMKREEEVEHELQSI